MREEWVEKHPQKSGHDPPLKWRHSHNRLLRETVFDRPFELLGSHYLRKGSMKSIKVISDAFTNTSRFLRLRNAVFLENGFRRSWDYVEVCCFKQ